MVYVKPASATRPVQAPARRPAQRSRRRELWLVAGALGVAAVVATVLIVASRSSSSSSSAPATLTGRAETAHLLRGIPQHGVVLGAPTAPVTLAEYADLQCPACRAWALGVLPAIVERYVRTGKVRLVFRGLAFIGPDSETALRAAFAAGGSGRLWTVVELLYRNQGSENAGWVTEDLLRATALASGLDPARVFARSASPAVADAISRSAEQARADGVPGTPFFVIGRTGGPLTPVVDAGRVGAAIDALLAG